MIIMETKDKKLRSGSWYFLIPPDCSTIGCSREAMGFLERDGEVGGAVYLCKKHYNEFIKTTKEKSGGD